MPKDGIQSLYFVTNPKLLNTLLTRFICGYRDLRPDQNFTWYHIAGPDKVRPLPKEAPVGTMAEKEMSN